MRLFLKRLLKYTLFYNKLELVIFTNNTHYQTNDNTNFCDISVRICQQLVDKYLLIKYDFFKLFDECQIIFLNAYSKKSGNKLILLF